MGVNPNRRIHQLSLDAAADYDILNWLNQIPKRRRSEAIRQAIRCYLTIQKGGGPAFSISSHVVQEEKQSRREKAEVDDWEM